MVRRRVYAVMGVFAFLLPAIIVSGSVSGKLLPPETDSIIDPVLEEQLLVDGVADFIIQFPQADLSHAYELDLTERRQYVYETLKASAEESQAAAIAYLESRGISFQSFFAGNELYVYSGDLQAATDLAASTQAVAVHPALEYQVDPTISAGEEVGKVNAVEWNIIDTGAPEFWASFGVIGQGIRVATISTGVQPNHPALASHYACGANTADPNCWLDATGTCGGALCDDVGSGTQITGVILGDDGGANQIGMAPGATWIACRACVSGSCSLADINECADWILAPNGSPANAPDIVYDNLVFSTSDDATFLPKVNAWRAAGIMPVISAGNYGPECGSVRSPGSYQETFTAAAHDSTRTIASWSGRGPSPFGHYPFTKPNISAPGVNIRTSTLSNGYATLNGSSFSGAHAAGAVALLWSLSPNMVGNLDITFRLLQNNSEVAPAGTCGAPDDGEGNYTYGYGYLDVYAAGLKISEWQVADAAPFDLTRLGCVWFDDGSGRSIYNQKAYCLGGRVGTLTYSDIWRFDPYDQTWSDTGMDLGTPVSNIRLGILKDNNFSFYGPAIFIIGGRNSAGVNIDTIQRFYPKVGIVNTLSTDPWPGKVSDVLVIPGECVSVDNKLYCFGGFENTSAPYTSAQTWVFDPLAPAGSAWTNIGANLSLARGYIQAATIGRYIYALGGDTYEGGLIAQTVSEYLDTSNLAAGWQAMEPLPVASGEGLGFAWKNKLYVVGGGLWPDQTALVQVYNLATKEWNLDFSPLWYARRNHGGFLVPLITLDSGDLFPSMWVIGGRISTDNPPYGLPEYHELPPHALYIPFVTRN